MNINYYTAPSAKQTVSIISSHFLLIFMCISRPFESEPISGSVYITPTVKSLISSNKYQDVRT